jgi:glycosyltransferase involved in cell wall biosynthesis
VNLDFLSLLSIEQQIIISCFVLFFIIQAVYYCAVFIRVAFYRAKSTNLSDLSQEGISVVICAHNESEKLEKLLPKILKQGHPAFEVIVVNHRSTDDSADVLNLLKLTYDNLIIRTIELDEIFTHNNAMAWGIGIKAAQYEWIVLTDINCYPENENWLMALRQNFGKKIDIVLSYTRIQRHKLVRADNFFDALSYLSKACAGKPYAGSGSNIAFRKDLFFNNRGFHPQLKLHDKADRIFANTVCKKANTSVDLGFESVNRSSLRLSFKEWMRKRRDELRSQRLFRPGTKNVGYFELVSRAFYYALFIVALICSLDVQWAWITVLSVFAARLIMQIIIFIKAQKQLKEKGLLFTSLYWDIVSLFLYLPIIILSKRERR